MAHCFDASTYERHLEEEIRTRIERAQHLILEVGGKLFEDRHAARVLPGFNPNSKWQVLKRLPHEKTFVVVINARHIEQNKRSSDNVSYAIKALRMAHTFQSYGKVVIVINKFKEEYRRAKAFMSMWSHTYHILTLPHIPNYPSTDALNSLTLPLNVRTPLTVITAPGPGSGKFTTALAMLLHNLKQHNTVGYAKLETFPVWNLKLHHPINVAYEAATADLGDVNVIDPYEKAYGKECVNYNRDVEIFALLKHIIQQFPTPYLTTLRSPTRMGINPIKKAINDEKQCERAAKREVWRRYFWAKEGVARGTHSEQEVEKLKQLCSLLNISSSLSLPKQRSVRITTKHKKVEAQGKDALLQAFKQLNSNIQTLWHAPLFLSNLEVESNYLFNEEELCVLKAMNALHVTDPLFF